MPDRSIIFKLNAIEGKMNNNIHYSNLLELLVFPFHLI